MAVVTAILFLVVVLLFPLKLSVNLYVQIDKKYCVLLIKFYRFTVFDLVLTLDGVAINYQGSISGSVPIINVEIVDVTTMFNAIVINEINCNVSMGLAKMNAISSVIGIVAVNTLTRLVNEHSDCTMNGTISASVENAITSNASLSVSPLAMILTAK